MGKDEEQFVLDALHSEWVTTIGPHKTAFEKEFCERLCPDAEALALNSGSSALSLAFRLLDIRAGDEILCSTLTFIASISAAVYMGAKPTFIDSEFNSWNMDPVLLEQELFRRKQKNCLPKAVVLTHVYGQSADLDRIADLCERFDVPLIEDAAEAVGTYCGKSHVGFRGKIGIFSFNGNKIITTGGGGMLCSKDSELMGRAHFLSFQAKAPGFEYVHEELGYNYNMSNVLAAIGRGQLKKLPSILEKKSQIHTRYKKSFEEVTGLSMMPSPNFESTSSYWMSVLRIDPKIFSISRHDIIQKMYEASIEVRNVWKPLHTQPVFVGCPSVGGGVAENLHEQSLCLPCGVGLTREAQDIVIKTLLEVLLK